MPNQLSIPFKQTWTIPIKDATWNFLEANGDAHPREFRWDINRWEQLRANAVGQAVHVDRINDNIRYHAQLVSILTKLPTDIGLEISYAPAFTPSASPITISNLAYERAAVLFNLAALYSQLAANEDRSTHEGVKRASVHFQNAAGTLSFLASNIVLSSNGDEGPSDLSGPSINAAEYLMLAQAQECVWQKAVMDNYKNVVVAKLAARVSAYYQSATSTIRNASSPIMHSVPANWLPHLETKQLHFESAAQYRKSMDDLEAHRYGHELSRLKLAQAHAKTGFGIARRGSVSPAVLQDIKSLLDNIQKDITRAERDNDLIYHQDVPPSTALPPIQDVNMVNSVVPAGLKNLDVALGNEPMIFGELPSWAAREAINIYQHRKETLLKDQIVDVALELQSSIDRMLRALNLPSSLEALEGSVGLPPSLLKKAEEVRLEDGPRRIEQSVADVKSLARRNVTILDQAMDVLDGEATEDEAARKDRNIDRPRSHEANQEFVEKAQQYRDMLEKASETDELVRSKWDDWEENITELTWSEAALEASVPSSTMSLSGQGTTAAPQTRIHARELRKLLEALDHVSREREELVEAANMLAEADGVRLRVMKVASGFERWAIVEPAMFEDIFDEELAKYDTFIDRLRQGDEQQNELLESVKACNELFLQSRREDPTVRNREHALQSLYLAYNKYREITHNLDEGIKFYNELSTLLTEFRETCQSWSRIRSEEISAISKAMEALSLHRAAESRSEAAIPQRGPPISASPQGRDRPPLPSLYSDEWQTIPPAPAPTSRQNRQRTRRPQYG